MGVLQDIQQRDDNLYRVILQADPVSPAIRQAGYGGTNRYEELMDLANAKLVVNTTQKLDVLSKRLFIQSKSFDDVIDTCTITGCCLTKIFIMDLCNCKMMPKMTGEVDLRKIIEYIVRGGWPASLGLPVESAALLPKEYLEAVLNDDIYRVDGVKRNTHKMRLLLRSLARNESTTVSNKTLKNDIKAIDEEDIDTATIADYLNILDRLFIIDNQKPFSTKIRSSVRIKQSEKRHFCDPSLACALLNITPNMLLNDLETLEFLFESLCERD